MSTLWLTKHGGQATAALHTSLRGKLQTLVYDILPPTINDYAIGLENLSANEQFFCISIVCNRQLKLYQAVSFIIAHVGQLRQHKQNPSRFVGEPGGEWGKQVGSMNEVTSQRLL